LGLDNLGGNTKVTEETGLSRIKSGTTGGDGHGRGSDRADLGGGFTDLGVEDSKDVNKIVVGEDDGGVSLELTADEVEVGLVGPGGILRLLTGVRGVSLGRLGVKLVDSFLHHGVLTTDHSGVDISHGSSHDTDLLGGDVIGVNEHHLGELGASILAFTPKDILALSGFLIGTHIYV